MNSDALVRALDVIEDGLLIVNRDFVIEYANEPAKKLIRKDHIIGMQSYDAIWDAGMPSGKTPSFIAFDSQKMASAERTFDDGTCLNVRAYPLDDEHVILTIWDITDYVTLESRLEKSGTDPVTGFRGSNMFSEDLEKELDRAKRSKSSLSLCLIEIGTSGEGDVEGDEEILRQASVIIEQTARSYDIPYRFKGDTFGVLMPHCPEEGSKNTAQRILDKLKAGIRNVQPSIGISTSENAFTGRDMLRLAERALYVAQHRGGNTIVVG